MQIRIRIQLKILMRIRMQIQGGGGKGQTKMCIPPGKILGTPLCSYDIHDISLLPKVIFGLLVEYRYELMNLTI